MNPVLILRDMLYELLPPRGRQIVYALMALVVLLWGIYEASQGDWAKFAGGVVVMLTGLMAASNTPDPHAGRHRSLPTDADGAAPPA